MPLSLNSKIKPTYAQTPFLGINPVLLNENVYYKYYLKHTQTVTLKLFFSKGKEIQMKNSSGLLCIKQPWPGIGRTIHGDHSRYFDTYLKPFPGNFID
jgi:acetyl-CoA synthetase